MFTGRLVFSRARNGADLQARDIVRPHPFVKEHDSGVQPTQMLFQFLPVNIEFWLDCLRSWSLAIDFHPENDDQLYLRRCAGLANSRPVTIESSSRADNTGDTVANLLRNFASQGPG